MAGTTFESVEVFYADDERRRRSPELDFGVWWRHLGVLYRLTWVDATGELVAVQLTGPTAIPLSRLEAELERVNFPREDVGAVADVFGEVFGVAIFGGKPESVTVLGVVRARDVVERLLDGWGEVCGEPDSLAWVLERVQRAGLEATA